MIEWVEEYLSLLRQLMGLQRKLVKAFEASITFDFEPFSSSDAIETHTYLEESLQRSRTLSQIVAEWPSQIFYNLMGWVKPTQGLIEFDGQNWIFLQHGISEIRFKMLPSDLDEESLEALRKGQEDIWRNLVTDNLPTVDITYLEGGRTDAVRAWSVYLFAQSTDSKSGPLTFDEHKERLKELVKKGILEVVPKNTEAVLAWQRPGADDNYFVFYPEIPCSLPPDELLSQFALELRHITNSLIGWARILQEPRYKEKRPEALGQICKITEGIKEVFVQLDNYLERCGQVKDEKLQANRQTQIKVLKTFRNQLKHLFDTIEKWSTNLQRLGTQDDWQFGIAQIQKSAEDMEELRVSVMREKG